MLRRIFGPKREEMTGGWRQLHNEELHKLYSSPNIIRIIKFIRRMWAWHVAQMGEKRTAYRLLVVKPEGKRPLGRSRRRWMDNIKKDIAEIEWDSVDWICLAQDRYRWRIFVNAIMNFRFHRMLGNYRVAKQLVPSRVALRSTELVGHHHHHRQISVKCIA
jgi:hypothetical protein